MLYSESLLRGEIAKVVVLFYLAPVWGTILARFLLKTRQHNLLNCLFDGSIMENVKKNSTESVNTTLMENVTQPFQGPGSDGKTSTET